MGSGSFVLGVLAVISVVYLGFYLLPVMLPGLLLFIMCAIIKGALRKRGWNFEKFDRFFDRFWEITMRAILFGVVLLLIWAVIYAWIRAIA